MYFTRSRNLIVVYRILFDESTISIINFLLPINEWDPEGDPSSALTRLFVKSGQVELSILLTASRQI
jgi:hypothetical protein